MSLPGPERKRARLSARLFMSALSPKADIAERDWDVR
jgi:hypothetical protein